MAECYILTGTSGTEARERNTGKSGKYSETRKGEEQ
jgi:hypothetical protein